MRLAIDDGYTIDAITKETITNETTGKAIAEGLPIVSFKYRPALPVALSNWRYDLSRAASGTAEVMATAKFVADHVVSWDVVDRNGVALAITADTIAKVPEPILSQMVNIIQAWAPKYQEAAVNLSSGSGSPS